MGLLRTKYRMLTHVTDKNRFIHLPLKLIKLTKIVKKMFSSFYTKIHFSGLLGSLFARQFTRVLTFFIFYFFVVPLMFHRRAKTRYKQSSKEMKGNFFLIWYLFILCTFLETSHHFWEFSGTGKINKLLPANVGQRL